VTRADISLWRRGSNGGDKNCDCFRRVSDLDGTGMAMPWASTFASPSRCRLLMAALLQMDFKRGMLKDGGMNRCVQTWACVQVQA